jgi:hypothetical protein
VAGLGVRQHRGGDDRPVQRTSAKCVERDPVFLRHRRVRPLERSIIKDPRVRSDDDPTDGGRLHRRHEGDDAVGVGGAGVIADGAHCREGGVGPRKRGRHSMGVPGISGQDLGGSVQRRIHRTPHDRRHRVSAREGLVHHRPTGPSARPEYQKVHPAEPYSPPCRSAGGHPDSLYWGTTVSSAGTVRTLGRDEPAG